MSTATRTRPRSNTTRRTSPPRPRTQPRSQSTQRPQVTKMRRVLTGPQAKPMLRTEGGWTQHRYTDGPLNTHRTHPRPQTGTRSPAWRHAIETRARARRIPWMAAFGVTVTSTLSWGVTSLFGTIEVAPLIPALAVATVPIVIGGLAACQARPRVGTWWPDLTAAMLAGAGLTFWVGMCGPSWWALLVLFVATVLCGARWFSAHPVGPRVPSLKPPQKPAQKPASDQPAEPMKVDEYATRWDQRVAQGREARLPASRLTNRTDREHAIDYRIEMRSDYTFDDLRPQQTRIAGMLGLPRKKIFFTPCSAEEAPSVAYLTIVTGEPVAGTRYYTGPTVAGGEICNLARFEDGSGELSITMYDEDGTKSVAVVGGQGGGKSASSNELLCGSLSTGAMNLLYIDPKGNSSTALRKRARVVLLGHEAALRAPELVQALNTARGDYAMATEQDVLLPSRPEPGWTIMHDEFIAVTGEPKVRAAWARMSNQMRAYGVWMITANQALQEGKWGDDATRAALTQQVIAFRINSESDTLLPGQTYRPNDLPTDEQGNTIPGHATQLGVSRPNVPALWDKLPRDGDTRDPEAPYTISTAFDAFFDQPDPLDTDTAAIESVLGPANADGRWIVGGPGATHRFPTEEELKAQKKAKAKTTSTSPSPAARPSDGFGLAPARETDNNGVSSEQGQNDPEAEELTRVQREVLALVEGGTSRGRDLEEAAHAARSSVRSALDELTARELLVKTGRSTWEPTGTTDQ